jgi:histidine kinase/DNA gyrase B/HSP90-like ATPase
MAVHYFDPNGVESLRDNGYRDTAMALAELLDNSIQAESSNIEIILIERLSTTGRREFLVDEILVVDNGHGMDKDVLETSMRFGGGSRHGAKKGLGRFGMGLPNSSASQCPRFEVYTWKKDGKIFFNYFDFKEIKENRSEFLPEVAEVKLPKHISSLVKPISPTGTIVRWMNCDRIILRRAAKLVPHIEWPLGRIFRYFISNQEAEIKIRVFQDNGSNFSERFELATIIKPLDPLFLMTNTQLPTPFNQEATSDIWEEGEYLFPDPNGDDENQKLYEKIKDSVKIKLSIAKKDIQINEGGGSPLGDIYEEMQGISVLRANREIKLDDFGFITDVSDPRNRWWKIELHFEPSFDKLFGLDNTKQNVHTFQRVDDKDLLERTDDDLTIDFIAGLSKFIEAQLKEMKAEIRNRNKGARGGGGGTGGGGTGGEDPVPPGPFPGGANPVPHPDPEPDPNPEPSADERKEAKQWLLLRYPEYAQDEQKLNLALDWFFKNSYKQFVVFLQLGAAEFYNFKSFGHKTIIEVNTNHDFFQEFILPIFNEEDLNKIDPILLLFGAMVEAEKDLVSYQQYISRFRSAFAVKLNQFILDWKENK